MKILETMTKCGKNLYLVIPRWFLPGCPLASLFGPDPLNFYPWDKFCVNYTAFDDTKFCKKFTPLREDSTPTEDEARQTRIQNLLEELSI